jgi:hypothetical protein
MVGNWIHTNGPLRLKLPRATAELKLAYEELNRRRGRRAQHATDPWPKAEWHGRFPLKVEKC